MLVCSLSIKESPEPTVHGLLVDWLRQLVIVSLVSVRNVFQQPSWKPDKTNSTGFYIYGIFFYAVMSDKPCFIA